jgi:hypothetical protein
MLQHHGVRGFPALLLLLLLGASAMLRAQDVPLADSTRVAVSSVAATASDTVSHDGLFEQPRGYVSPFTVDEQPTLRTWLAGGVVGGLFVGSMVDSYFAWWQKRENRFRFHEDGWFGEQGVGIDKLGHFFTSHFYFQTFYDMLRWGGFGHTTSYWSAAAATFTFALLIEIGDGTTTLGFDYQDLVYNSAGLLYGMLQKEYPFFNNFRFTWSYVPYDSYKFPPRFTEHYDAHTYWIAVDLHNLLPASLDAYWPAWLQPAVGYSVRDHFTSWHFATGKPEFVVGLELNLMAWPLHQREAHLAQRIVSHFHLPLPAVKFSEGKEPVWRVLYQQ